MKSIYFALLLALAAGSEFLTEGEKTLRSSFPDEKFISDLIPIDSSYSFYFLLFKSRDNNPTAPLVLWLQGGPGTSGVETALFENGPFRIKDDITAKRVAHSLNNNTDVLYIDQPIGTGFSHCSNILRLVTDEVQVANDLYNFLLGFFKKYPQYKARPLYIAGQSYGGHFIPGAFPLILEKHNPDINVKGIAIGNGHISPINQFPQYAEYAYKRRLINVITYETARESLKLCKFYLNLGLTFYGMIEFYCTGAFNLIVGVSPFLKFNPYDVRESCKHPPACYDFSKLTAFMDKAEVLKELNMAGKSWLMSNLEILLALRFDYWRDYSSGVSYFLEHGIPVILYYGKDDFICNYYGGIETIRGLKWGGAEKLLKGDYKNWVVDGKVMGEYKHHDKLTYLEVFEAGHMAMMDNPRIGLDIINRLVKNGPY